MEDKLFLPQGHVNAYKKEGGIWVPILDQHNDILPNAKTILCKCLSSSGNQLDYIVAYLAGSILHAAPIVAVEYPATNQVRFRAVFSATEAVGTIDEFRLTSSISGDFSRIDNISITKPALEMAVVWTISFDDCPVSPGPGGGNDFNTDFNNDFNT